MENLLPKSPFDHEYLRKKVKNLHPPELGQVGAEDSIKKLSCDKGKTVFF